MVDQQRFGQNVDFEAKIYDAMSRWFREPLRRDRGTATQIRCAQLRFDFPLPAIVVRYFRAFGNASDLNQAFYHICSHNDVQHAYVDNIGYLVVGFSHQRLTSFGIHSQNLVSDNPEVVEIVNQRPQLAFQTASDYYYFTVLWQIINELTPVRATAYPSEQILKKIRTDSTVISFYGANTGDLQFFCQGNSLLLVTTEGQRPIVSVASRENATVAALCQRYGIVPVDYRQLPSAVP